VLKLNEVISLINTMKAEEKIQKLESQIKELEDQIKTLKKESMEQWFKSLLHGLQIEIDDSNPDSVFYKKDGKQFFELYQDSEKTYFYCNYDLVWAIFNNKYNLNYDETQSFIRNMIEQHLKLNKVTPRPTFSPSLMGECRTTPKTK
jgi:hypothetical protein